MDQPSPASYTNNGVITINGADCKNGWSGIARMGPLIYFLRRGCQKKEPPPLIEGWLKIRGCFVALCCWGCGIKCVKGVWGWGRLRLL